jgi:hypothetical protein
MHGHVLIAPGAFYREHPRYGSDGRLVREAAALAGLTVEMLPVASIGGVRENAAIVRDRLATRRNRPSAHAPLILVSLSKGGADVRLALEQLGTPPSSLRAWIQVCGLVHGTPVADRAMGSWWRRSPAAAYLAMRGGRMSLVEELTAGDGTLLSSRATAPPGVLVINVVAFPMRRHTFGITRLRHRFLATRGPNDGLALLRDEIVEPGLTLPVWGTDHYFRVQGIPDVLSRMFRYIEEQHTAVGARSQEAQEDRATQRRRSAIDQAERTGAEMRPLDIARHGAGSRSF